MSEVLAEHIEYLSLPHRRESYARAISAVMPEGARVADLGCGVGVLGLMCLKAGASKVYGIDRSEAIHLARETMERAGLSHAYECVAQSTFHAQLPEPVDLLICDHIGFFGIDYGIARMLDDARERFLKPGGAIMPRGIVLVLAPVRSDEWAQKMRAWESEAIEPELHWIGQMARNARYPAQFDAQELVGEPRKLGELRFDEPCPQVSAFETRLIVETSGRIDGLGGWFEADLGGSVTMTNSPLDSQSIERPQAFLPLEQPIAAEAGDQLSIRVTYRHDADILSWTVSGPREGERQTMSGWKSRILSPADLKRQTGGQPQLSPLGRARRMILDMVAVGEPVDLIERALIEADPPIFPSAETAQDFLRQVLNHDCQ